MKTENTYIIHPDNQEQANALMAFARALKIKFEVIKEKAYNPEFVSKIQESKQQAIQGKIINIDLNEIWKD